MSFIGSRRALLSGGAKGPSLDLNFLRGGTIDPRITFTRASTATYFDVTGTLQTAVANAPRTDYDPTTHAIRGLLIEEARTNSIRNPRAEGAVVGTPGTAPTNWTIAAATSLSSSVIGTGTETGIPYVDVRMFGTATAAQCQVFAETTTAVAAVNGQVWDTSIYLRLVGGTLSGISSIQLGISQRTNTGVAIADLFGSALASITGAPLATQRFDTAQTLNQATVAFIFPKLLLTNTLTAIDFTLRIGAPQLELGAFVTSLMLPVVATPAASARAVDNATMPVASWYNPTMGSVVAEAMTPVSTTQTNGLVLFDDGTLNNRLVLRELIANAISCIYVVSNSITTTAAPPGTFTTGTPFKAGTVMQANTLAATLNGATPVSASGAAPAGLTMLRIGQNGIGIGFTNGYIRRLRYWPRPLSNPELQRATT